jgi:hypothetical protein
MRARLLLARLSIAVFAVALGSTAYAAELAWKGTLTAKIGTFGAASLTGTGVMTVNGSAGGSHLTELHLGTPGITGTTTVPVTDPEVTGIGILAIKLSQISEGSTALGPFSGGGPLTQNQAEVRGFARICVFFAGCDSAFLPLPLAENGTGAGQGGFQTIGGFGTVRVSLTHNPWTVGTTAISNIGTDDGGVITRTAAGFSHGPASGSSTNVASGVLQIVTASTTVTAGIPTGGAPNAKSSIFTSITLHVIPEPGFLLMLAVGVAGLAVLGHRRLRK